MILRLLAGGLLLHAQEDFRLEHFEKKIRPVLASKCFQCHSAKMKSPMAGLALDTKDGTKRVVASGKLLEALRFQSPNLQMPPAGKLPQAVIQDFEEWVKSGAVDPRESAVISSSGIDISKAGKWWAFQPLRKSNSSIDEFLRDALRANGLSASAEADRRTLIRRVSLNLTGFAPDYEEIEAFAADPDPMAYEKLVDRLLRDPGYGERWGRYWLDVVRWG
ncbi:MAG: DUF1549 domain-containing protein, partial [Acidobacteria bacterium]|nr:DUF1549 domain-containing protein [Acidobacteriota bacterium]